MIKQSITQWYSSLSPWAFLTIGIVFEVIATSALKLSNGFTESWATTVCILSFIIALIALSQSVKSLEIGVVYAIWSGLGITLITLIGLVFFGESVTVAKFVFIALIVVGVIGLQIVSPDPVNNSVNSNSSHSSSQSDA